MGVELDDIKLPVVKHPPIYPALLFSVELEIILVHPAIHRDTEPVDPSTAYQAGETADKVIAVPEVAA